MENDDIPKVICKLCEKPIVSPATAYIQVTGWVRPRAQGGANAIALKEVTGELAHASCIEVAKVEIPGQLSIA